jgi:ribosomal protein S17
MLGDFNAKVGKEDIFKPTIGNESLHEISNDNGVRIVNFAMSKNLIVKRTMFPHRTINKFTWTRSAEKTHNQIDHILIGDGIQIYLMSDLSRQQIVILTTNWWWQS